MFMTVGEDMFGEDYVLEFCGERTQRCDKENQD